jgi:hypothetical protein
VAINTVEDIANGLVNRQDPPFTFIKAMGGPKATGSFASSWLAGGRPAAGATPPAYTAGSGYTYSSATPGAIPFTNAAVNNWLAKLTLNCNLPLTLMLVDRLWSCSGMGFAAATYTVTTPGSLPARITDGGVGVEAWVENYVAAGAATGTLTLNYLNTLGAAKSGVISTVVSAPSAQQIQPIPLAVGDLGVSQVTSVVTSATWTSGSFGVTLLKRLATASLELLNGRATMDWATLGLSKIPNDACLSLVIMANSTSAPTVAGSIDLITG